MKRIVACVLILLAVVGGATTPTRAHVIDANKAALSVKEANAYLTMSVPVSALSGFDDNHDQLIDLTELGHHYAELRDQIAPRVRVTADGAAPIESLVMVSSPLTGEDEQKPTSFLVALIAHRFAMPPQNLNLWTDLFGPHDKEQRLAVIAQKGDDTELTVLNPERPDYTFFRGPLAVFGTFVGTGLYHILAGFDHLLFLLTIIAAAMSMRQWAIILTGFTLAHSITLTLATLQVVSINPALVEPLIAASIVLLALDNFFGGTQRRFAVRASIVFACGLLHGLGFASALSDYGLSGTNLLPGLFGFNLGVECGQFLFVGVALLALRLINAIAQRPIAHQKVVVAASTLAIVPALSMVVMRVFEMG